MKRYDLELTATGPVMEERKEGAFVPFAEVEQLQAKIFGLLEERNSTGIAINNAIRSGILPDKHPLRSRLELLSNHHKREQALADGMVAMAGRCTLLADLLREVTQIVPAIGVATDDLPVVDGFLERIEAALAGNLPEPADQHPDDAAVDRFVVAMKAKLAAAREKGRGGWDDPNACSVEYLADLLVNHVAKGNAGTFEDVANFAMMLHQRGADPAILASAATLTTCATCSGHGMIGGVTGQTPESMDFWETGCPDCDGRGKVKVNTRTITEGQEFEFTTVLQSIASGFSDDPAHDAAALLKRITGEMQWTGDSFQLPPHQGGELCATEPPSSSPD
ncbi:zinc finger-like domain-containing protein [Aeromonas bestiarum]|uniref:Zinc finger-like domain-containing protein n=1 Tax=Aeromonas bestiarum TaxID=105751 RepID=A0AAW7I7T1_9GAMM|nr:zinc finger-like domain-containing protein [Aeromonas bestiarum]MDM5138498.1 zinc finger-like domain-containing protein [Aeromonas bestiarum]